MTDKFNAEGYYDPVTYQTVLEKRYLCFSAWEQIAVDMNYSIQHIHRMHSAALKEITIPHDDES